MGFYNEAIAYDMWDCARSLNMKIAIVSTFFNRKEKTLSCLKSLYSQSCLTEKNIQLDIYFCDDASTDGTSIEIEKQFPEVHIVKGTGNLFWAKGMHKAFERAIQTEHDFYLMVNDDVDFYPSMLKDMLDSYFENKDKAPLIAVVGSTEDGAGNWTYGGQVWNKKLLHERYDSVLPAEPCHECNMTNWNCFLIPREMVDNLGIIDGFYEHAKADNDYSNRIINSGNKIFVAKRYIGICQRNSLKNTWRDTSFPLKRRIELVKRPNGLPIKSEIYYCKKFHGKSWPLWVAKRYVWIFISALKK